MLARLEIHLSLWSSLLTDLNLNFAILNRLSTRSLGAAPWSHLGSQKRGAFPITYLNSCGREKELHTHRVRYLQDVLPWPFLGVEEKKSCIPIGSDTFRMFFHGISLVSHL
jgi:hypothetical protein